MGLGDPFPPDIEDPEMFFACMVLSFLLLVYFVAHQAWMMRLEGETPFSGKQKPNFSVMAHGVKSWMLRLATSTTLAMLLLGIELWPLTDGADGRNDYLCNSYLDYSDMFWPLLFCVATTSFLIGDVFLRPGIEKTICEETGLLGDEKVLIIGNGRGAIMCRLAQWNPICGLDLEDESSMRITAVDPYDSTLSPIAMEWAEENVRRAGVADMCRVFTGDARELMFEDFSFDVVVCNFASPIYPLQDHRRVVEELTRVLAPGGKMVFIWPMGFAGGLCQEARKLHPMKKETWVFTLPLPIRIVVLRAKDDTGVVLESSWNPRKQATIKPTPYLRGEKVDIYGKPKHGVMLPVCLLIINVLVLVIIVLLTVVMWPYLDVPSSVTPYNRLGSGLITSIIVWMAYGAVETFHRTRTRYSDNGLITSRRRLLRIWLVWSVGTTIGAIVWSVPFYVLTLCLDLIIPSKPWQNALNPLLSLIVVYALLVCARKLLWFWQRQKFLRAAPHLLSSFPVTEPLVYAADFNKSSKENPTGVSLSHSSASALASSGGANQDGVHASKKSLLGPSKSPRNSNPKLHNSMRTLQGSSSPSMKSSAAPHGSCGSLQIPGQYMPINSDSAPTTLASSFGSYGSVWDTTNMD
mmetsp:Transcript_665/g.2348  ORF Transcript_665/g.2348 Transcript_665/m.2348 type:complete len:635 (+) Transcript_665:116-2020(+)